MSGQQPPPPPPRPYETNQHQTPMLSNYGAMGGYGGGIGNSYGVGGYPGAYSGGYGYGGGMFGGGYGGGYGGGGPYGYHGMTDSNFARLAEEQSRGAFQSIESVVNAVSSVANMLNSTHNAVYSTFRAVIGVVEQFGRLKTQLSSVVVSIAIFRWISKFWRWLLVILRLKPANYASAAELAWNDASQPYAIDVLGTATRSGAAVNWPAALFWVVAIGGPWLIYKCVAQMVKQAEERRQWATSTGDHYAAQGIFDFQASNEQELSFMKGEMLRVAPKEEQPKMRGWILASSSDGVRIGLVPYNYIKIMGKKSKSPPLVQDSLPNTFPARDTNSNSR